MRKPAPVLSGASSHPVLTFSVKKRNVITEIDKTNISKNKDFYTINNETPTMWPSDHSLLINTWVWDKNSQKLITSQTQVKIYCNVHLKDKFQQIIHNKRVF